MVASIQAMHDDLMRRYAVKEFVPHKMLDEELVDQILNAARLAPSSMNLQPRKFIIVTDRLLRRKLYEQACNQVKVTESSHLLVLCHRKQITQEYIEHLVQHTAQERGQSLVDLEGYRGMLMGRQEKQTLEQMAIMAKQQVYLAL